MRLDNPNEIVPAELLSMPLNYLKNEISLISNLDYYGFLKSNFKELGSNTVSWL